MPAPLPTSRTGPPRAVRRQTCHRCGCEKPLNAFPRATAEGGDPHRSTCKRCAARRAAVDPGAPAFPTSQAPLCCRHCAETKPAEQFMPDLRTQHGHRPECRDCHERLASHAGAHAVDLSVPDELIPHNTLLKEARVALGIAVAHACCPVGHCRTLQEIAAYADVSVEAIRLIEQGALRKVRRHLSRHLREAGFTEAEVSL